jgi:protocatechuate 3,4-dioxygenase, beta subunit
MTDPAPFAPEEAGTQPPSLFPDFVSSRTRAPGHAPIKIPQTLTETTGPGGLWEKLMGPAAADLTKQHKGQPLGERIILKGRVLDGEGRPVPHTIVELVQANAAGRYAHMYDQHDAPLDPNFSGVGRAVTDADGSYQFITVKPGAYPWANGPNTWRPQHIHFSLFGPAFATRLVTQMYFPGDPLFPLDAIACSVPEHARRRIVCSFDPKATLPYWALAYHFDFVLRGRDATPMDAEHGE